MKLIQSFLGIQFDFLFLFFFFTFMSYGCQNVTPEALSPEALSPALRFCTCIIVNNSGLGGMFEGFVS